MQIEIEGKRYPYNVAPDNCPRCHHGIEPRLLSSNIVKRDRYDGDILQLLYRCPRQGCQYAFIATYWQGKNMHSMALNEVFSLRNTAPFSSEEPAVSDEIKKVSANFVEIYCQAYMAERYGLDQIAGVGYRKSLEYLIKDFCISKHPDKDQEIKESFLGVCINNFTDDANIKECAKRAAWLGNDESHYVRKWEDKEIKDLKILIELTMAWIRNHVLTAQYLADMSSSG
ncbi:MAG: hypothetical protein WAO76_12465 [Georgfuchsia sp.]